jgi:hypothetical protein
MSVECQNHSYPPPHLPHRDQRQPSPSPRCRPAPCLATGSMQQTCASSIRRCWACPLSCPTLAVVDTIWGPWRGRRRASGPGKVGGQDLATADVMPAGAQKASLSGLPPPTSPRPPVCRPHTPAGVIRIFHNHPSRCCPCDVRLALPLWPPAGDWGVGGSRGCGGVCAGSQVVACLLTTVSCCCLFDC